MDIYSPVHGPVQVTDDEYKLILKYRECLEKLKPGMDVPVGRAWSFPLIDSSGDQIHCSVSVSHSSWEPKSSSAEVIVERAKARMTPRAHPDQP